MVRAPAEAAPDSDAPAPPAPGQLPMSWAQLRRRQQLLLPLGDALAAVVAPLIAVAPYPNGASGYSTSPVWSASFALAWPALLWSCRAYEGRFLGTGSDEFRRVGSAGVRLLALVAIVVLAIKVPVARGFVGLSIPITVALTLLWRVAAREVLRRQRGRGRGLQRVIVVGRRLAAERLCAGFATGVGGMAVVGVCTDGRRELRAADASWPVVGELTVADVLAARVLHGADTVAIASDSGLTPRQLRQLSWSLEGVEVDFLVGTDLIEVAGPRIHVRPVSGMPLLHVEEPELRGARHVLKASYDRGIALALLVLLSPVWLAIALAIRLDSRGPVFYRQTRVGRHGRPFTCWKFRSMRVGADAELAALAHANEGDGLLFKMRDDPRVTRVGRRLRAWSLDEVPQLVNVLLGSMSLVGPRPPLPSEVAAYPDDVRRRLLVKPGLTGLWQVSGRSDLSWDQAVRLDLSYVENWSPALDAAILVRTVAAVLRRSGAY